MKKLRIIHADRFVREQYDIQQGEEYQVISEGQGEKKYGYMVNSKQGKPIVIYKEECVLID